MRFPFYKQPDTMDCGPATLRMIAKFYGKTISIQRLRHLMEVGKDGVSLLGIRKAAETIGFRTYATKLTYQALVEDATLPAILHWDQNHFVVLYKTGKKKLFIADPAKGLFTLDSREFASHWITQEENGDEKGIVLLLEPARLFYDANNESDSVSADRSSTLRFKGIFRYLSPFKRLIFQLLMGLGAGSILQLIVPFLTQSVVDTGINTSDIQFIYIILIAQLALFIGRLTIDFIRGWILLHISSRINLSILTDFLAKLTRLPISFFDSKHTGDILQRMNDHKRIESFLTSSSLYVLFSFVNLIAFSIVLAFFNTGIFLVFCVASLLYVIWVFLFLNGRKQLDYKRFDISAKQQGALIQLIHGMQEIKLNTAEQPMRWNWERLQAKNFHLGMRSLSLNQWQQSGAMFINEGKNIFITFLSAKAVVDGQMTLGTMLAVQYIIGQLNSPVEQMVGFVQSWQNAKISMDRLNEIQSMQDEESEDESVQQDIPPIFSRQLIGGQMQTLPIISEGYSIEKESRSETTDYPEYPLPETSNKLEAAIKISDLTFVYPGAGNAPALKNIDLTIPLGCTTAIVGASGSGKTTLLKLLLRFYPPQRGDISIADVPLANISPKRWRKRCGVVMQESYIFSDTIAKNIAVGEENIDMGKLRRSIDISNLNQFVSSLPLGINTKIGSEGAGLSMGQKQRILIARAIYKDPDLILFDEATNSLDANNEKEIVEKLGSFFRGRTVVIVAHRLSTVKFADQIIVMSNGEILERGTHDELINVKGEYFNLIKNQLELGL